MPAAIRVLLVDDEVAFVRSLEKVLTRRGMAVQCAHDGKTALALTSGEEFDVILLDVRMPGMDGLATLEQIRKGDALTPVLLLTGHIDLERTRRALKGGATEVFLKPCPVETLVSAIENAQEWKTIQRELAHASRRE
ncbi:MAG: response regulator [bacterium]